MHLFDSLKDLSFLIMIPKYKENMFYYDILIGFKTESNLKLLESLNFKFLNIKQINQLYDFAGYLSEHEPKIHLNEQVISNIFDFKYNIFNNTLSNDGLNTLSQLNGHSDVNFDTKINQFYYLYHYKKEVFKLICVHFNIYNNSTNTMINFFLDTINNHFIYINLNILY